MKYSSNILTRITSGIVSFAFTASLLTGCTGTNVGNSNIGVAPMSVSVNLMENIIARSVDQMNDLTLGEEVVTDFALRLFKESISEHNNTLISPLSVLIALSMTANGADNNTLSEMEAVLGMSVEELNKWVHSYMRNLPEEEQYKLKEANSVWFKKADTADSLKISRDFLQTVADYYSADIYESSFNNNTCDDINQWVEDKTDGMIRDILDQVPTNAVMYLINALAFEAEWEDIYEEHAIRDAEFTKEDGTIQEIELMYSTEGVYLEDENAVGFIKYYKDRKYAFAALLPKEGVTVSEYVSTLDGETLMSLFDNASSVTVDAAIPKFETEYKVQMNEILADLGMDDAFDPAKADFSRMDEAHSRDLYISRVIHQTYINVDAKGTQAGAATVVEVLTKGFDIFAEEPKQVYLNRPFVYMLIDCESNIPFFIGTMMDAEG